MSLEAKYLGQKRFLDKHIRSGGTVGLITSALVFDTEQTISVPSIPSAEAFGGLVVLPGEVTIQVPSIGSGEAFGDLTVEHQISSEQTIIIPSIGSGEEFGSLTVVPGEVTISVPSIVSQEAFGDLVLAQTGGPQTIEVPSIISGETFGILDVDLGPPPQEIIVPSISSEEEFGGLVVEQVAPSIAIAMPSIISAEEFGIPTLILGSEPIYLPPPDPDAEPGAGTFDLWLSGTPAYLSRNGFDLFITGLWYPGQLSYISYGRLSNFTGTNLKIPKNDSRRAKTSIYLDDPVVKYVRAYSRMLRIHYRGRLVYWGVINLPEYNLEENTVTINSIDPSIRLYHHMLRFGDLENTEAGLGSPAPGGLDANGKGLVYVSSLGLRLLRDAGNNLEEQTLRGVPDLGIVNGYNDWHVEVPGFPDHIEVSRGDRVLEKMKDLSNQLTGPDFEFEPVSGQPGAYARLNTYYKQGVDRTGSVGFYYGTLTDNLENVEVSYGEEFVTHVHTLDRGSKYRYTEANVTASEEHGIYVWWDATDFDVAKLTPAMREKVLRAHAKGILEVYGRPLESYTLHCKVETNTSPWYMRDYAIGDIIKIGGVKGHFRFEDEVRIVDISLDQVDDAGNVRPTLMVVPTIPTIDVVADDPDVPVISSPDPTITISPSSGSEVAGTIQLYAYITGTEGEQVQFFVDGVEYGSLLTAIPYNLALDTTTMADGAHTFSADLRDGSGTVVATSGVHNLTVSNTNPPPPEEPPPGETPAVFPSRLRASGMHIVDENDFILDRMTAVNIHCLPTYIPSQADLNDIASHEGSWVRVAIQWKWIEPTQGVFDPTMRSQLDTLVTRLQTAGLYAMLELHLNIGAVPSWTTGVDETAKYNNGGEYITKQLALRYGANKVVMGFSLNEIPAYQATLIYGNSAIPYLEQVQRTMITWFRTHAPNWIGFVTLGYSNQTPYPDSPRTAANPNAYDSVGGNVVMDVHFYTAGVNSTDPNYDGRQPNGMIYPTYQGGQAYWMISDYPLTYVDTATHRSQMLAFLTDYVTFCTAANIPLCIGEIGWPYNNTGGEAAWWAAVMTILAAVDPAMVAQWIYSSNVPPQEYWPAKPGGVWNPYVVTLLASGD